MVFFLPSLFFRSVFLWPTCPTMATIGWACTHLSTWLPFFTHGQTWNSTLSHLCNLLTSTSSFFLNKGTPSGRCVCMGIYPILSTLVFFCPGQLLWGLSTSERSTFTTDYEHIITLTWSKNSGILGGLTQVRVFLFLSSRKFSIIQVFTCCVERDMHILLEPHAQNKHDAYIFLLGKNYVICFSEPYITNKCTQLDMLL